MFFRAATASIDRPGPYTLPGVCTGEINRVRSNGIGDAGGSAIKVFTAVLLCLSFNVLAADHDVALPPPVPKIMAGYNIPMDSLSLYIKEHNADRPLLELNADIPRNPASVIKLVTTYAGLELLGPDFTWETHFHLDGKLDGDTLNGNLILQGGGDPFLVKETFWYLLHTLQSKGLKHIDGDLLIDDGLFEETTGSPGDFDQKPYRVYNVFPDAALINFRAHQFHFLPQDDSVRVYAEPPAANLSVKNKLRLVEGRCRGRHNLIHMNVIKKYQRVVVEFTGDYPRGCGEQELIRAVLSNDLYIYGVFKSMWEQMGGTISGGVGKAPAYDDGHPFYVVPSKPLSEIINYINKYSNNVMARQLLLTIGQVTSGADHGSREMGVQAIKDWLDKTGIPTTGLVMDNGSGLSRKTRITARALGRLLEHAYRGPFQPEFFASLSLAGIDGTMKKRLGGEIPAGDVRVKTGVIDDVRAMAGYVRSKNNHEYFIVSLQNYPGIHHTVGTVIQDEILKWLYEQ